MNADSIINSMSFTDQKQRVATQEECLARWGGSAPGERFRCYLCGHKTQVGDKWRWVFAGDIRCLNFHVCEKCDRPDVKDRWAAANQEAKLRFWWMR